jgi:hypothetical protein
MSWSCAAGIHVVIGIHDGALAGFISFATVLIDKTGTTGLP